MTVQETIAYLTEGLDETNAAAVRAAFANEKVAQRAATLKQQREFDTIEAKTNELQARLDGSNGRPGAAAYEQWYATNFKEIERLQRERALYEERYGALNGAAPAQPAAAAAPAISEEAIAAMVDKRIQGQYGNQWANLLKGSGRMVEKHMRSGRKTDIDWDKVTEIAAQKGGDIMAGYDEWDAPEREKASKVAEDKRVEDRVQQEVEKRMAKDTAKYFPAGADGTPSDSPLSRRSTGADGAPAKYDRAKVIEAALTGKYNGYADEGGSRRGADFFKQ